MDRLLFNLAAQWAVFLFKGFDIAFAQQLGLVDPVVTANASSKIAQFGIDLTNVARAPIGNLFKCRDAQ